ncbi:MAG: hypothetical protein WC523_04330 [Patescibacteria group bacterium]
MSDKVPNTQKALGILKGVSKINTLFDCNFSYITPYHILIKDVEDIESIPYYYYPGFARPCPLFPRHGFVESRTVSASEELKNLLKDVKNEDAFGEIVLGPHLKDIHHNAVYTSSGLLSVGPGNDGATGGKNSISFPVGPTKFPSSFCKDVKIKKGEAIYLESIFNGNVDTLCYITQVRGGPTLDGFAEDYVPEDMKVSKVVIPSQDLLKWEKEVQTFKSGTVVYGNGFTLASHAAIHCVLHQVPFVVSKKPNIGDILKATETNKANKLSREDFNKGICFALKMNNEEEIGCYFKYCLAVLHNWAYLKNCPQASQMLGASVTLFAKLCSALSFGEYRHNDKCNLLNNDMLRESVYKTVLSKGTTYLSKLPKIYKTFYASPWEDGFGGIPWASCAWYSSAIWKTVVDMYNKKSKTLSDKEIASLMDNINRTVNLVHNSDWWFDKISQKEEMDTIAKYPGLSALMVASTFYEVSKGTENIKKVYKKLPSINFSSFPFFKNSKGKLVCAYMHPEDDAFNLRCSKCGEYDCWCNVKKKIPSSIKATVKIWKEGSDVKSEKTITLTNKEFVSIKKQELENGKVYLKVIPAVGVKLPTGRIVKCGGL